jgi:hypothetical protein
MVRRATRAPPKHSDATVAQAAEMVSVTYHCVSGWNG